MSENNTLSKGQIALQQARRRGFNVKELPEALKKEIIEFNEIGLSVKDIAEHFNIMEYAVSHCLGIKKDVGLPIAKANGKIAAAAAADIKKEKVDRYYKTIGVSKNSYDYITSLATILGTTRLAVVDSITTYLQKDNNRQFLLKSIKDE